VGDTEELKEGAAGTGAGVVSKETQPEAKQPQPEAVAAERGQQEAPAPGLSPELEAEISKRIQTATQEIVNKYEGKDGDIAKLKSSYDKKMAELRRQVREQQQAQYQQAMSLVDEDPAQAAQLMQGQLQQQYMQYEVEQARQEWRDWVRDQYEASGFDVDEDEVAGEAAAAVDALLQQAISGNGQAAAMSFQEQLRTKALSKKDEALAATEKRLKELETGLEATIKQEIARYLADNGMTPDATRLGPRGKTLRHENNPDVLLAEGMADVTAKLRDASRR
jgi:hypothetical protein